MLAIIAVIFAVGSLFVLTAADAQPPGATRAELQRRDPGAPGREASQMRVDLAPAEERNGRPFVTLPGDVGVPPPSIVRRIG